MKPITKLLKPGDGIITTDYVIPYEVFSFSGQTDFDTWNLRNTFEDFGPGVYSDWLVDELPFCLQRIKDLVYAFPLWQHHARTGRPPAKERYLMIGYLIKQFFQATYRQTKAWLYLLKDFFGIQKVPDHTTLSLKNRTKRWSVIWKRFHKYVLSFLPKRTTPVATDATGFSSRKAGWNETAYAVRANQDWVKVHATVEPNTFFILSYAFTESNIHESQMFETVWDDLHSTVIPSRSLADGAYAGNICAEIALKHGATPHHKVKGNAVHYPFPENAYQKMANFQIHWPNRFKYIYGDRNHSETAFSMIGSRFGHRIRCRTKIGRKNEIQSKINAHNIRALAIRMYLNLN